MIDSDPQAVDFLGYQIECFQDDDGCTYVPLKRLCELLGIDHKWQTKKVKSEEIFDGKVLSVPGKDGRHRKMFCLPLKRIHFWMFRVDPNIVRPEIIERLLEYRDESETAMSHFVNYGILIDPRVPAEQLEAANRECLEKRMEGILAHLPEQHRQLELVQTELALFERVPYESRLYNDKVSDCMTVAINRDKKWLANFEVDASPDAKLLEKMDELKSLEKDYRDLHSIKDDLFELCNRLKDREQELCDQLWQVCCRVHERCEAIYSLILDLKEDLGCRYTWQVPLITVE
ncbi:MAG: phage antirepressor N-terminal domain-containing protein [Desulfomonilaceae bacterium]